MDEGLLTVSQAANYLQVCDKTVLRLIKSQKLTASKIGNRWRIKSSDIDKYVSNNTNSADRGENDE